MTPERIARLDALPGWSWGPWRDRPSWDDYYSLLVRYVTREGHSRVPRLHVESEQKLGVWVANQRAYYRGGTRRLTPDQAKRLEALTGWFWSALDDAWEGGFSRLQTYVARHGHARVPQKYADESGYRLGLWVTNQRRHNAGRARSMTIDRRDRLEALPGWTWELRRRSRGNERQG